MWLEGRSVWNRNFYYLRLAALLCPTPDAELELGWRHSNTLDIALFMQETYVWPILIRKWE